ncbi:HAD family phosphatase [Nonomuraea turkmeniaca]|uniref:HAD family phosphatase n=1 Tax=Nonomuraea turkmeniaca TaxID=103838 RepID=A0A5S4FQI2_9ACTN|nr:HAD family phosphatase [Nonomuraea turkmeniaca]TMR22441.1 HAD family phosphatase [Nonomuraea turkmeniaca]
MNVEIVEQYAGIIFDWDGTVVDSQPLNYAALCTALLPYGVTVDRSWYWQRLGISTAELLTQLPGSSELPAEDVLAACRRAIIARAGELVPHQPVLALARRAKAARLGVAVASGGAADVVRAGIVAVGAAAMFDVVVTREEVEEGKPAPDLFLEAARRLCVDPARCVVVEDAEEGFMAARRAGMAVIDVRSVLAADRSYSER